jgi:hypothetical protein
MPWIHFTSDYDHRWASGAITEFLAGMTVHVKEEVAKAAKGAGAARAAEKPKEGKDGHIPTPSREESKRVGLMRVRTVKAGGRGYDNSGNPINGETLPDAADPKALRSEPLVERDRARVAGLPEDQVEDLDSESQIPPADDEGGDKKD